jgi:hypothetical protein
MPDPALLSRDLAERSLPERYKARVEWLERAARDFEAVRVVAEGESTPSAALVMRHLQAMLNAAADADCLSREDRTMLADKARGIARIAHQRQFEDLLHKGQAVMRGDSPGRIEPMIAAAQQLMEKLKQLQLDPHALSGLKVKLDILLDTTRRGDSAKAKMDAPPKPQPLAQDKRLFLRYREPVLLVQLAGRRYRTANWGLGGLMLAGVVQCPGAIGDLVNIRFWLEGGCVHEERATIVWYQASGERLGLQLRRYGSAMVAVKQECDVRRLVPRA